MRVAQWLIGLVAARPGQSVLTALLLAVVILLRELGVIPAELAQQLWDAVAALRQ